MEKPLSKTERTRFEDLLRMITKAAEEDVRAQITMGTAMVEIRDDRLYREEYGTFEELCTDVWGYSRSYAYRLIDFSTIRGQLKDRGVKILPQSESQVRPLKKLKAPEDRVAAWQDASDPKLSPIGDKPPPQSAVQRAVESRLPHTQPPPDTTNSKSEPRRAECFNCGQMYTPPDSYWDTHVVAQKLPITEQRRILRGIEEHISKVTGLKIPAPKTEKQKKAAAVFWYQVERELAELSHWNLQEAEILIEKSAKHRHDSGIMIESPKTIIGIARAIAAGQTSGKQTGLDILKQDYAEAEAELEARRGT